MEINKDEIIEEIEIDGIGNYYGGLWIAKTKNLKYYWTIQNYYDGFEYEEIPESLYLEIKKFNQKELSVIACGHCNKELMKFAESKREKDGAIREHYFCDDCDVGWHNYLELKETINLEIK